jgi:hypothetical protein
VLSATSLAGSRHDRYVLYASGFMVCSRSACAAPLVTALTLFRVLLCCCGCTGVNHPLWSHSYLGYGFDVVQTKVDSLVHQLAHTGSASDLPWDTALLSSAVMAMQSNRTGPGAAAAAHQVASAFQPAAAGDSSSGSGSASPQQQVAVSAAVHVVGDGVVDPCLPAGYTSADGRIGSGVWQQCQQLVQAVINPAACKPVQAIPCPEIPDNMPKLQGEGRCWHWLGCADSHSSVIGSFCTLM